MTQGNLRRGAALKARPGRFGAAGNAPDLPVPAVVRLDRFLCKARLFKHRTEAQRQIAAGLVLQNGVRPKPAHAVRRGDRLFIRYLRFDLEVEVLEVPEGQVSKARAAGLVRVVARRPRNTP